MEIQGVCLYRQPLFSCRGEAIV